MLSLFKSIVYPPSHLLEQTRQGLRKKKKKVVCDIHDAFHCLPDRPGEEGGIKVSFIIMGQSIPNIRSPALGRGMCATETTFQDAVQVTVLYIPCTRGSDDHDPKPSGLFQNHIESLEDIDFLFKQQKKRDEAERKPHSSKNATPSHSQQTHLPP